MGLNTDTRPKVDVLIEGSTVAAMFDSGSGATILDYRAYKRLKGAPPLEKDKINLTTANGSRLPVKGSATLKFTIGNRVCKRRTIVVDNLTMPCIIGEDTLNEEHMIIDYGRKVIRFEPQSGISFRSTKKYIIQPMETCIVSLRMDQPHSALPKDGQLTLIEGHHLDSGITKTDYNGCCLVKVRNNDLVPLQIERKQLIGSGEWVRNEDICSITMHNNKLPTKKNNCNLPVADLNKALSNVPQDWKGKYSELLQEYSSIFATTKNDVGCLKGMSHKIRLIQEDKVSCRPPIPIPEAMKPIAQEYVQRLLSNDCIEPSSSPWCAPILILRKPGAVNKGTLKDLKAGYKSGPDISDIGASYRVVVDLRSLNENVRRDSYPIPNINSMINQVASYKIKSVADLSQGYWNLKLDEESREKTAFSCNGRLYQWRRLPMGYVNASGAFMRAVHKVVENLSNVHVYVDDVLCGADTHQEHLVQLRSLFQRFKSYGLKIRLSKLQLATSDVRFLGFNLCKEGVRAGEAKTQAIKDWPECDSVDAVRRFYSLCSFFRRTIKDFAIIAAPLTELTKKGSGYSHGPLPEQAKAAFYLLKSKLCSRPCLKPIDYKRPLYLTTDASLQGISGVITQYYNGVEYPCAFYSRVLRSAERNYAPFKLEAIAVRSSMLHYKPILLGHHFTLRTDHRPITTCLTSRGHGLDQVYADLSEFLPFTIEHVKGTQCVADPVSRMYTPSNSKQCSCIIAEILKTKPQSKTVDQPCSTSNSSKQSVAPQTAIEKTAAAAPMHQTSENAAAAAGAQPAVGSLVNAVEHVVTWPPERVRSLQCQDKYLKSLLCFIRYGQKPDSANLRRWVMKLAKVAKVNKDGLLGEKSSDGARFRIYAPLSLRTTLLDMAHDAHLTGGHYGAEKVYQRLSHDWAWQNMRDEIFNYCRSCVTCGRTNAPRDMRPAPLQPVLPEATFFNQTVHWDMTGKLNKGELGGYYILIIIDSYSGLLKLVSLPNKSAELVSQALIDHWITSHSLMNRLIGDQGSENVAKVTQNLCQKLNIDQAWCSKGKPSANGLAERAVRSTKEYIKKLVDKNQNWEGLLRSLEYSFNICPSSTRKYSAFHLAYGRRPTVSPFTPVSTNYSECPTEQKLHQHLLLQDHVRELRHKSFLQQKTAFDKKAKLRIVEIGDIIFVKDAENESRAKAWRRPFSGPFVVTAKHANLNFTVRHLYKRRVLKCHLNRIKLSCYRQQHYRFLKGAALPSSSPSDNNGTSAHSSSSDASSPENLISSEIIMDDDETFLRVPPFQPAAATPPSPSASPTTQSEESEDEGGGDEGGGDGGGGSGPTATSDNLQRESDGEGAAAPLPPRKTAQQSGEGRLRRSNPRTDLRVEEEEGAGRPHGLRLQQAMHKMKKTAHMFKSAGADPQLKQSSSETHSSDMESTQGAVPRRSSRPTKPPDFFQAGTGRKRKK